VNTPFLADDFTLLAAQAALVALPAAGVPPWLARFRGRGWALIPPLSIAVVVAAIAAVPDVAVALSWLALIAIPPGAALALGWASRGARPWLALLAVPLLVLGWTQQTNYAGDAALAVLSALSCLTLGRLLAGVVPLLWLEAGIVAMAVVDSILVFGHQLQGPNEILNTAVPAVGLPQLQYLALPHASLGFGDVFVAGLFGGVLAARGVRQLPVAALTLGLALLWDLMFYVVDTIPATVPVAAALLVVRGLNRRAAGHRSTTCGSSSPARAARSAPRRSPPSTTPATTSRPANSPPPSSSVAAPSPTSRPT
jgi:hypothetical protein